MENHFLQMENKRRITVTEVISVDGFDEETILVNLQGEGLVITGQNLHIEVLDLEEGKLIAEGEVESVAYTKKKARKSLFERFRR